eukprot:1194524-Prorocentrum_minimum.AAC.1
MASPTRNPTISRMSKEERDQMKRETILQELESDAENAHPLLKEVSSCRADLKELRREVPFACGAFAKTCQASPSDLVCHFVVQQNVRGMKSTLDMAMKAMLQLTSEINTLERDLNKSKKQNAIRVSRVPSLSATRNSRPRSGGNLYSLEYVFQTIVYTAR